jgi:hypothetical protein
MEKVGILLINKHMWHRSLKAVVEVISRGHFPTTAIVRLNNSEFETDIIELEPLT